MPASYGLGLCALRGSLYSASATLPPGFPLTGGEPNLSLTFMNNTVSPSGALIPHAETIAPPNITTPTWTSTSTSILIVVDIDAPVNNTRVQVLHFLSSGVTLSPDNRTLVIPSSSEAGWVQPSPSAGDIAHAYTVLLFAQPDDFRVPEEFQRVLQTRIPFNVSAFVGAAKLGEPVAANWFSVQNVSATATATATASFAPLAGMATGGVKGNPAEFTGGAVEMGSQCAWVMDGAVVAGLVGMVL
ncbi:PEBP-like protein [Bimuria novae-zelandiae CBS 107.79]|uniref:PEBP-like protein n=1 Tax=Bimuria novae-zelandiae CBS 107.79 TaxID=1447943 RepID=A0A6A5VB45_9PLEO|nr:PEBP-like protein [Bimuria novae-zelandiae CBS 107.79]